MLDIEVAYPSIAVVLLKLAKGHTGVSHAICSYTFIFLFFFVMMALEFSDCNTLQMYAFYVVKVFV
jgi:hypothetical protein